MFQHARNLYVLIVIVILSSAVLIRGADPFFVQALRLIAFDSFQLLNPAAYDPEQPVRIVDINEESLGKIGQWPWPRTIIADLLRKLGEQGAAVVAFDVLFSEPDRTSPEQTAKLLPPAEAQALTAAVADQPTHDQVLARAIGETPTVLAAILGARPGSPRVKAGFAIVGDDPAPFITSLAGASGNLPEFDEAAAGIGSINWVPDRDQVVRRVPLVYRVGNQYVPTLVMEALRVAMGANTYLLKGSNAGGTEAFGQNSGLNTIRVGDLEIPTDNGGSMWLRFRPAHPESYIPAWKVLAGENNPQDVAGKIVLVGTSAPGLLDLRATPLNPVIPGFEIHAQAMEHIIAGRTLIRPDFALGIEQAIMVILGLALAAILPRLGALASALLGVSVIGTLLIGAYAVYVYFSLLFDPSFPALVIFVLVTTATIYVYRRAEQQRGEVRRAFGYYVAPAVVNEIIANPNKLELGGEVRELTLLFCDVRNFTSISEHMTAHELTTFINRLLTPLSEIILGNRGTIDKYMGDAIMAFWNAPLDDSDHAGNAWRSALAMIKRMESLNVEWRKEAEASGRPYSRVAIGIGINSGNCCVGNLGSSQRFDYSAIGDDVNVASRLEGLSKVYGVPVVVSEATAEKVAGLRTLELDLIRVKGRERPTRIYTVFDAFDAPVESFEGLADKHEQMLAAYRTQDWDGAERSIAACTESGLQGLAHLYELYKGRIASWRLAPPPPDWDGTFTATSK